MNNAETPRRWFDGWRSAERPAVEDPADLGTAFGLDMSLGEEPAPAAAVPAASPRNWVQRMADRRRRGS